MTTTFSPSETDVVYTPSGVTSHYNQVANVFIPNVSRRVKKRPCFIFANNSGFSATTYHTSITTDSGLFYLLLAAGWVVISAKTTVKNQTDSVAHGAIISGLGMFKPQSSSYFASTASLEKDGCLLVQFARSHAIDYGIDVNNVYIGGRSAGSAAAMAAALYPDMGEAGQIYGCYSLPSRPNGMVGRAFTFAYVPGFAQSGTTISLSAAAHFCTDNSAAGTFNVAASDIGATPATMAGTNQQTRCSSLNYGFNRTLTWYLDVLKAQQKAIDITNRTQNFYLYGPGDDITIESVVFNDGSTAWDYSTAPASNPYGSGGGSYIASTLTQLHSAWNAYAMRTALGEIGVQFGVGHGRSRLVTSPATENYVKNSSPTGYNAPDVVLNATDSTYLDPAEIDQFNWLQERVANNG